MKLLNIPLNTEKNNHFRDFINDRLEYDPNSSEGLKLDRIYDNYKQWYQSNHPDTKAIKSEKISRVILTTNMVNIIHQVLKRRKKDIKV